MDRGLNSLTKCLQLFSYYFWFFPMRFSLAYTKQEWRQFVKLVKFQNQNFTTFFTGQANNKASFIKLFIA
jgi:hypothetical protein